MKELAKYLSYWFMLHCTFYGIEQAHHYYCTPSGTLGFIQSIFTSNSQVCVCLRSASYLTSNASANLFTVLSIYVLNKFPANFGKLPFSTHNPFKKSTNSQNFITTKN